VAALPHPAILMQAVLLFRQHKDTLAVQATPQHLILCRAAVVARARLVEQVMAQLI